VLEGETIVTATKGNDGAFEPRALLGSILLVSAVLLQSLAYGFAYRLGADTQIVFYFAIASLFFFGAMAAIAGLTTGMFNCPAHLVSKFDPEQVAAALLALVVAASCYFSPALPGKVAIAAAGVLAIATATSLFMKRPRPAIWVATGVGIVLHAVGIWLIPIDVKAANMLPIIVAGCQDLLHGENPLMKMYPGIATAPLYYLPGTVLPYCAPVAADLDPRALNLAILLLLLGLLFRFQRFSSQPAAAALTTLPVLLSPMAMQMGYYGHVWPYWLHVVGFAMAVLRGRYLLAAVLLGLALATRQMAVFVYGMLGAVMFRELGLSRALVYGAIAAAVFALLVSPFLSDANVTLADLYYGGVRTAAVETHGATLNPADQIALSGSFVWLGMRDWMMPLQVALAVLVTGALLLFATPSRHTAIVRIGVSYVVVIGASAFLHRYFYAPGFFLIALGLGEWLSQANEPSLKYLSTTHHEDSQDVVGPASNRIAIRSPE
jgi:hypothetical protein